MAEMSLSQAAAMLRVLADVEADRHRQHAKWGEQNHPDGTGGEPSRIRSAADVDRLRAIRREHADAAKDLCRSVFAEGRGTFRHILREEVDEAIAEDDLAKLRAELVQVAAVAVQWIEAIDRRKP